MPRAIRGGVLEHDNGLAARAVSSDGAVPPGVFPSTDRVVARAAAADDEFAGKRQAEHNSCLWLVSAVALEPHQHAGKSPAR